MPGLDHSAACEATVGMPIAVAHPAPALEVGPGPDADTVEQPLNKFPCRGGRGDRVFCEFGPLRSNELCSHNAASGLLERRGFSIICGLHHDFDGDPNSCSSDCSFGTAGLAEDGVLRRLKRWALRGYKIRGEEEPTPRRCHMREYGPARRHTEPLTLEEWDNVPMPLFAACDLKGL